jgi:hypothetical protein
MFKYTIFMINKLSIIFLLYIGLTSDAHAYLDPGTGSVILSAIIAGLVAIKSFWYTIIYKIKNLFKKKNKTNNK